MRAKNVAAQSDTGFRAKSELARCTGFTKAHDVAYDSNASDPGDDDECGSTTAVARVDPDAFERGINVELQSRNRACVLMDVVKIHNYVSESGKVRSLVCTLGDAGIVRPEVLYKTAFGGDGACGYSTSDYRKSRSRNLHKNSDMAIFMQYRSAGHNELRGITNTYVFFYKWP